MVNRYYKRILREYLQTAEFKEHQQKHHMSHDETAKAVADDDRHDRVGRFLISAEKVSEIMMQLIDTNHPAIQDWCSICESATPGESVSETYNIKCKSVIGESFTQNGIEECNYYVFSVSFKKGRRKDYDFMKIKSIYPSPYPIKNK